MLIEFKTTEGNAAVRYDAIERVFDLSESTGCRVRCLCEGELTSLDSTEPAADIIKRVNKVYERHHWASLGTARQAEDR